MILPDIIEHINGHPIITASAASTDTAQIYQRMLAGRKQQSSWNLIPILIIW